jgi:hypothetical protein
LCDSPRARRLYPSEAGMNTNDSIGAAIAVFLASAALFGLVVGAHDLTLRDEPFAVSVVGAALLTAGVLVLVAAVLLGLVATRKMSMRMWLGRLILLACLVVAGVGLLFAVGELASFEPTARVYGVAALVMALPSPA